MIEVRRARPLLGTLVDIRVRSRDERAALTAIETAFKEIAIIQALMSFHEPSSELSRLNRHAVEGPVAVDPRTSEVIALAMEIAESSSGRFDPTIAGSLVTWGILPTPASLAQPDEAASWRDVRIHGNRVSYDRPLWLDLGGIAKGFAVDRAIECLTAAGVAVACVNAGGDLRVIGNAETVHLRAPGADSLMFLPALELRDGSMASSAGHLERRKVAGRWIGPHVDGRTRRPTGVSSIVSVIAERCAVADALTKVVLADRRFARHFLPRYGASALAHDRRSGWAIVAST